MNELLEKNYIILIKNLFVSLNYMGLESELDRGHISEAEFQQKLKTDKKFSYLPERDVDFEELNTIKKILDSVLDKPIPPEIIMDLFSLKELTK